jgi:hypothetical protein
VPEWVPVDNLEFYVYVTPAVRAAFSGQFDVIAAEARAATNADLSVALPEWRGADLTLLSRAMSSWSTKVTTGVRVLIKIPIGFTTVTVVDVNASTSKDFPGQAQNTQFQKAHFGSVLDAVFGGKSFNDFRTFKLNLNADPTDAGPAYLTQCLADNIVVPPEKPPEATATPGDASKLFENEIDVPCNVCAFSWGADKFEPSADDQSATFLPISRPVGAKVWKCNMVRKNGCHDVCKLNVKTGNISYFGPPDATQVLENKLLGKIYDGNVCFQSLVR